MSYEAARRARIRARMRVRNFSAQGPQRMDVPSAPRGAPQDRQLPDSTCRRAHLACRERAGRLYMDCG